MASQGEVEREAARPMEWFKHDANASQDIKCKRLVRRLGMEGYGRWWRLCEMLASTNDHMLNLESAEDAEIIADELMLDGVSELMGFVQTLADVGLVMMPGDGTVYSERMLSNAATFGNNRANGRLGGRPRKSAVKTDH